MTEPISISFDVTAALPADVTDGARIRIAAWLFLPDDVSLLDEEPVLMTLLHGGSYDKRYHDIQVPGRSDYSCARHLAALGNIVLLPDVLGVSDSSRLPVQAKADRHIVALANHAAAAQCAERLRAGDIAPGFPALPRLVHIGGGHSMGGMLTMTQQAAHRTYAGVMIIGYTAIGIRREYLGSDEPKQAPTPTPRDYIMVEHAPFAHIFHWPDVPADALAVDETLAVEVPASIGTIGVQPGVVREDAAAIDVPVYICLGESDNSPDPHAEPACYSASRDITLQILEGSGHCQNFASTRHTLWEAMHRWSRGVAESTTE